MTHSAWPGRGVLVSLAAVLVLGLGALATAEVTLSERELLVFQVGERGLEVRIEPELILAEGLELRRTEDGLVGTLEGQPVELRWDDDGRVVGRAAGDVVRLQVSSRAFLPGLDLEGWLGPEPVALTLSPTAIEGTVGGCDYSLPMAGNRYSGWRTCDLTRGPPVSVALRIPEDLVLLDPAEEAALLALLLAGEAPAAGAPGAGTPSP